MPAVNDHASEGHLPCAMLSSLASFEMQGQRKPLQAYFAQRESAMLIEQRMLHNPKELAMAFQFIRNLFQSPVPAQSIETEQPSHSLR
jgi:hypothetical protein